jgi:hypothetical protein
MNAKQAKIQSLKACAPEVESIKKEIEKATKNGQFSITIGAISSGVQRILIDDGYNVSDVSVDSIVGGMAGVIGYGVEISW